MNFGFIQVGPPRHFIAKAALSAALLQALFALPVAQAQQGGFSASALPWLPSPPEASQPTGAESAAQALADSAFFATRSGEMRIDGTVRAINSKRKRFVLETDVMVLQSDSSGELNSLPARTILIDRATILWMPSGEGAFDFALLSREQEVIVIGVASPDGRFVRARLVALSRDVMPSTPRRSAPNSKRTSVAQIPLAQEPVRRTTAKPSPPKTPLPVAFPEKSRPASQNDATQTAATAPKVLSRPTKAVAARPVTEKSQAAKENITQSNAAAPVARGTLSRMTLMAATPRVTFRHGDSKLSAMPAPTTQLSPLRPNSTPPLNERAQGSLPSEGEARLNAPLSTAPRVIPVPPRLSSSPSSAPVGRLANSFAGPDNQPALSEAPLDQPTRTIVPPLDAHPDSQKAQSEAARENAQRAWQAAARPRFHASREAQRDIHFTYFSGSDSTSTAAPTEKLIALTFDDGPHPANTLAVLDVLKRERVPATFFVVGRNVEKHPELVLRAVAEGHEIANHTYRHLQRASMSVGEWTQEIAHNNRVLTGLLGGAPRWFRAPGCRYSFAALQAINELGMIRVDTTNNSGDWEQPDPDAIVRRVLNRLAPGQVLLFHDTAPQTARALPLLLAELKQRGYRCVGLTELAQRAQATPGFQPLWCPPGQGIVIAAPNPDSTTATAGEAAHPVVHSEVPLPAETTP